MKTIRIEPLAEDLRSNNKDNTINKIGINSKVSGVKSQTNSSTKLTRSKNII